MCLLMKVSKDSRFSDVFLDGVYSRNSDGLGIFWFADGKLSYIKTLPKSAAEATQFFREHAEGKDCVAHYRMATHGDVADKNTHPYPLLGFSGDEGAEVPMLLAHNGILSTGNAADKTRSDTYHYIQDYLRPILAKSPELLTEPAFVKLVSSHIGAGNKFAIMDALGNTVLFNEQAFIEYEGSLLSNTYAWDYYKLHPKAPKYSGSYGSYGGHSAWQGNDWWDDETPRGKSYNPAKPTVNPMKPAESKTLTRKEKKEALKALNKYSNGSLPALKDVIAEYSKRLAEEEPDLADVVKTQQLTALFFRIGRFDAADFMDLLFDKVIDGTEFLKGIEDPLVAARLVGLSFLDSDKLKVGL